MLNPDHPPLSELYDALDCGLIVVDADMRVKSWNAWMESSSGVPRDVAIGQMLGDVFAGASSPRLKAAVDQVVAFGASRVLSHALNPHLMPLRTYAGRPLVHDVSVKPLGEAPARQCLIQVVDVTVSAERERFLRERHSARYAAVVDNAPDAILTLDDSGIVQFANSAIAREFGYEPRELIGKSAKIIFQNDDEWARIWAGIIGGTSSQRDREAIGRRKNRSLTHVEISASRWQDRARAFISVILRDVNERFEAQEALRRWSEMLEERVASALAERKVLADIVEGTNAFVEVIDNNYDLLAVNRAAAAEVQRIYGFRPRAGDNILQLLADKPEHQAAVKQIWARALAGESFTEVQEFGDPTLDRPSYELRFNPLYDSAGNIIGAYQFVYDVTERLRDQRRLLETEEALRQSQKMEAIGQLTGGIAHDFNNLLAGIIGAMEMLRRRIKAGRYDESQRFMDAAVASANRAASLTHRLLAFARRQPLDPRPIDPNQLVGSMEDLLRRTMGEQVHFETKLQPDAWAINADANQLENALLNLAINARDAMPDGGKLAISTENVSLAQGNGSGDVPAGDYLVMRVSDTGLGMSAEVIAKVWDPFFTTKPIGQGTGLGLSMVYGFAQQSGGQARIESAEGRGTSVILYLPRYAGSIARDAVALSDAPLPSGDGETVMLVEDDAGVRLLIGEVLRDLGYRCVEAIDAQAALPMITSNARLDLLITDVGLPKMNGRQLAEIARQHRPGLKILFVTGYAEHATGVERFLEPGMELVTKPFTLDALALKIREMLIAHA